MAPARRPHPIVAAFTDTPKDFLTILRESRAPRDPMVETMLRLREAPHSERSIDAALGQAGETPLQGADPDLTLLLPGLWCNTALIAGRKTEALALFHRDRS